MKAINASILSLFLLGGINEANAQAIRKAGIEHKEVAPIKENEVKEAPHIEAIAPQPIHHTEITPVKESETHAETVPTPLPVEEPKAEPTTEKTEWVKNEPGPAKTAPASNTNSQNNTFVKPSRLAINRGQVRPMVRRVEMKPLVIDTTKGK